LTNEQIEQISKLYLEQGKSEKQIMANDNITKKYRIGWVNLITGSKGHGEWFDKLGSLDDSVDLLNKQYIGLISHYIEIMEGNKIYRESEDHIKLTKILDYLKQITAFLNLSTETQAKLHDTLMEESEEFRTLILNTIF